MFYQKGDDDETSLGSGGVISSPRRPFFPLETSLGVRVRAGSETSYLVDPPWSFLRDPKNNSGDNSGDSGTGP